MRPISVVIGTRNEVGLVDRDCELTEAKWRPNRASWIWLILSNFITRPHRDLGVDGRGWWAWYHGLDIERLRSRFVLYQSKSSLGWISRSRVLFFIQYFINIFLKYYYSQNLVFGGEFGRFSPLFRLFRPIIVDHGRVHRGIPPGKLSELFQWRQPESTGRLREKTRATWGTGEEYRLSFDIQHPRANQVSSVYLTQRFQFELCSVSLEDNH